MKPQKLTLETDYKINGNSTGCALDTLALAVDGRDSNDIDDGDQDHYAIEYVMENYDYESDMLEAATKKELKTWLADPQAQAAALDAYTEAAKECAYDYYDQDTPLAKEIQKVVDAQRDQNYKEWLYGDYRDWAGILVMASRRYSESDIDFTTEKGEVYATIPQSVIDEWINNGEGDGKRMTQKDAREYLEASINADARAAYNKRMSENAARKVERERLAAYKAEQAARAEIERKARIKKLISKAK